MSVLTFLPLASSSKGNAYLVTERDTHILLDAGLTAKELRKRCPIPLSEIDACFITHEHNDHSKCVGQLIRMGIPVYMSEGTALALDQEEANIMDSRETVRIGHVRVMSFDTYHNTEQPFGFLIGSDMGEKLMFAVDTANLNYIIPNLTQIAIECNYASDLLDRMDRLPEKVIDRIRRSHMEIQTAIAYLRKLDLTRVQKIYLLHMSAYSGDEWRFMRAFQRIFPDIDIEICKE